MGFATWRGAFGIVCCEASAFALPQIVPDIDGLPVRDGENGIRLPAAASGLEYAAAIQALLEDHNRYVSLACSSRAMFESRLNWDAWGRSMDQIFRTVLEARSESCQNDPPPPPSPPPPPPPPP